MTPWEELQNECNRCRACALSATRKNVVFGVGNTEAEVLFIGEGPGANEDEQGLPFVGAAGKLLDDMLAMIGLKREAVYITNIVKCRPPQNRDPLNTEKDACIGYLRRQVAMMRPKIIVCLGRIAAAELIKPDFKITQEHGQFFEKRGVQMTALYHPAALLRDSSKKPETFLDLKALQAKILQVCQHTSMEYL
ncbi:MAG: uracil-DNA glycosylase [Firmicutes bacterium]|nr:uracil-DNA glycosylase [Bacillota bacterium]